jgi:hypothetical protein
MLARLTDEDRELLHGFVQRRDKLKPDARSRLAQSLGSRLSTRLGQGAPNTAQAEAFLNTLLLLMKEESTTQAANEAQKR